MYLIDKENVTPLRVSNTEPLQDQVFKFLKSENIESVCLEGQDDFIKKYAKDITQTITTKYSNNNVEVFVNGKIFN